MKQLFTLLSAAMVSLFLSLPAVAITVPKAQTFKKPAQDIESAANATGRLLDINIATEDELKELPGVDDTYAKKIIDGRPYSNKDQLVSRKILPGAVYASIKDRILVK